MNDLSVRFCLPVEKVTRILLLLADGVSWDIRRSRGVGQIRQR